MMVNHSYWRQFPELETERLLLREITLADAPDIFATYSDPEVMRYWGSPPHASIEESCLMIQGIAGSFMAQEGIRWGITLKPSNQIIGSCGHWRMIKRHFRTEIGYELARPFWGHGIMAEAVEAIVQFGFTRMGLHSVEAQIDPANTRSARLLERLRFHREGYQRENFFVDGRFLDTILYARLCTD
jgi:ribosomal-protein-alanine N-acetyltransferase